MRVDIFYQIFNQNSTQASHTNFALQGYIKKIFTTKFKYTLTGDVYCDIKMSEHLFKMVR